MTEVRDPVETICEHLARWQTPVVDLACFGSADAEHIAALVDAFCPR